VRARGFDWQKIRRTTGMELRTPFAMCAPRHTVESRLVRIGRPPPVGLGTAGGMGVRPQCQLNGPFGMGCETLSIAARAPAPAGQWPAVPCGECERAAPSPKMDSGEGFASEAAPWSSVDADFLHTPDRRGSLALSRARPVVRAANGLPASPTSA
jgi:hypothetical protein